MKWIWRNGYKRSKTVLDLLVVNTILQSTIYNQGKSFIEQNSFNL
jgi:hypothetical protein